MSDSNSSALAYQREATWGVPAAPVALKYLRFTKEDLDHDKQTVKSKTIRSDRQTDESVETGISAKGGFDFEHVVGDMDLFLESALYGTWTTIASVPTLINGTTRTSFLLEKKVADASFVSFKGCMVDQLMFKLASRAIIDCSISFIGLQGVVAANTLDSSGTITAAGTGPIMSASANVANLTIDAVANTSVKSVDLTINNNTRGNDVIGKKTIDEVGLGEVAVTGKVEAYFRNTTLLAQFIAHSAVALVFETSREPVGAVSGDHVGYRFTVGKLRWTKGMPKVPGKNTDIMIPLEFDAEATTGVAASKVLTLTGQPLNTETVAMGGKTYTFQTTLTNVDGNVLIGATASDSLDNLIAAVNLAAGAGATYAAAMTINTQVSAAAGAGDTLTATAQAIGTAGNAIVVGETLTNGSWAAGAVLLSGGVDSFTIKVEKLLKA